MDIHQLSVNYIQEQDRILVRINTQAGEELRLWLTRRLCLNLRPHLQAKALELESRGNPAVPSDPGTRELVSEFKRQETLMKADFKTPYSATAQTLPLGPTPLLVTHVQLSHTDAGQMRLALEERMADGSNPRGFQVSLGLQLLHGLLHLLDAAVLASQWQETAPAGAAVAQPAGPGQAPPKLMH